MDARARDWQQRFDDDFEDGLLVMSYMEDEDLGSEEDVTSSNKLFIPYRTRRVTVTGMRSPFSPNIRFESSMGMSTKDVSMTIDTYTVEQEEPCKIVRVTDLDGEVWRFSGCLSETAKRDLDRSEWGS
jgi:hypothetical protein